MRWLAAALLALGFFGLRAKWPVAAAPDIFTDVTAQAGIHWRHVNGESSEKFLIEAMGGGVAFVDFDHDGLPICFLSPAARRQKARAERRPAMRSTAIWATANSRT